MVLPFDLRKAVCGSAGSSNGIGGDDNEFAFFILISSLRNQLINTPAKRRSAKLYLVSSGHAVNDALSAGVNESELSAQAGRCDCYISFCEEDVAGDPVVTSTENPEALNHVDISPAGEVIFKGKPVTKEYIDFISECPAEQALLTISVSSSSIYIKSKKRH